MSLTLRQNAINIGQDPFNLKKCVGAFFRIIIIFFCIFKILSRKNRGAKDRDRGGFFVE